MLFEQVQSDLKNAMLDKDQPRVITLRSVWALMKNALVVGTKRESLSDEEVIELIKKAVKQRKDSIEQYTKGDRKDLAEQEEYELSIIKTYLPEELSDEELTKIVNETTTELNITSKQDFGKLMGAIMKKVSGRADGTRIKEMVEKVLT